VLISSHLVHELERICDWIGLLDGGRLVTQMPMQDFKNGLKRLRVGQAPLVLEDAPFTLLARNRVNGPGSGEQWLVRGWNPDMQEYLVSAASHCAKWWTWISRKASSSCCAPRAAKRNRRRTCFEPLPRRNGSGRAASH
jgi:ABC-type multidrug transport system ATPase subunit